MSKHAYLNVPWLVSAYEESKNNDGLRATQHVVRRELVDADNYSIAILYN